ncbi:MAG: hypothetical protein LUC49_06775 [Prevotella sp.]|nr:hypothetical protein [Prevotella sp.]
MKRSKYDGELPGGDDSQPDGITYLERTTELAEQCNRIDGQIKEIERLCSLLGSLQSELNGAISKANELKPALDAAVGNASNITDGITRAIVKAENTPIKVALGEDDLKLLASHHKELIDTERKLIQSEHDEHLNTLRRTLRRDPAIYLSGTLATFITWLFWLSLIFALGMILAIVIVHVVGK